MILVFYLRITGTHGCARTPLHKTQKTTTLLLQHPVVNKALGCLESAWRRTPEEAQGSHFHTRALLAYAFALPSDQAKRTEILKSLDEGVIKQDESTHQAVFPTPFQWVERKGEECRIPENNLPQMQTF